MGYECLQKITGMHAPYPGRRKEKNMKKLKATIAAILGGLLLCTPLIGCNKKDDNTIRLCEVTHSIFYAPLYVALNNGYFDDYGLTIKLSNGGGANNVMTAIASKSADIGLMGPEATIYCHVAGQKDYPVIFGQLTKRDGSFLVSKKEEPNFTWADTANKHVLAGRKGGVPAMTLQYVMNQAGVDTSSSNFDTSVQFDVMVGAFEGSDEYDYCTMFEPTASEFVAAGKGHIVASVGRDSGDVPYTAFSAKKSYLKNNEKKVTDFLRAVVRGYNFMKENDLDTVAKALEKSFAGTPLSSIKASIESYLAIDAWNATPVMKEADFNRLQDIMENAGELSTRADFSVAVDNKIASIVAAELL